MTYQKTDREKKIDQMLRYKDCPIFYTAEAALNFALQRFSYLGYDLKEPIELIRREDKDA